MKTTHSLKLAAALLFALAFVPGAQAADHAPAENTVQSSADQDRSSKELRRSAMSLELLGRGLLYSFNYDYLINDSLALGAGASTYSIGSGTTSASAWIIPVYANYYLTQGNNRWFTTAGANLIFASASVGDDSRVSGSGVAGVLGGGYEYRGDGGFLFRAAPYVFIGKASGVWLGLSFGYTI
jgi:hypothetical protein